MPCLLNFIEDNGVLTANDHTALISHTATGILTSLTGVYPDLKGSRVHGRGERTAGRSKPLAALAWQSGADVRSRHHHTPVEPESWKQARGAAKAPWVSSTACTRSRLSKPYIFFVKAARMRWPTISSSPGCSIHTPTTSVFASAGMP